MHADALDQVVRLHQGPPGSVHQDDAVLHLFDGVDVDDMVGGVHQRAVEGNDIAVRKQAVKGDVLHEIFQGFVLVDVMGDDLHAEAVTDAAHGCAYFAGADDAGGLLVEIEAHQTA